MISSAWAMRCGTSPTSLLHSPSSVACLRPGGRLLVLEISKPAGRIGTAVLKTYMRGVVPLIARVVARRAASPELWRYYWDTIEACITPEAVLAALRAAGFENASRHVELGIFSEYTATKPG